MYIYICIYSKCFSTIPVILLYWLCSHHKKRMYSFFSEYEKALCKKWCLSNRHRYVEHCLENYVQHIVYMKKGDSTWCLYWYANFNLACTLTWEHTVATPTFTKKILCFTLFYMLCINFVWRKIICRFFISADRTHLTCIYPKSFDPMPMPSIWD